MTKSINISITNSISLVSIVTSNSRLRIINHYKYYSVNITAFTIRSIIKFKIYIDDGG